MTALDVLADSGLRRGGPPGVVTCRENLLVALPRRAGLATIAAARAADAGRLDRAARFATTAGVMG